MYFFYSQSYIQYSKTRNFYLFEINNNLTFIYQILTVLGPLEEKYSVFNPLGFKIESNFDNETSKIKSHSTRASKQNLIDKSHIHGRETRSIFRFSAETLEPELNTLAICQKLIDSLLL